MSSFSASRIVDWSRKTCLNPPSKPGDDIDGSALKNRLDEIARSFLSFSCLQPDQRWIISP
jgi:hypothetical protein